MTFHALLNYLYTDSVDFAPLTSSFLPPGDAHSEASITGLGTNRSQAAALFNKQMLAAHRARRELIVNFCEQHPDKKGSCSAKSMYKLADKMNIQELKQRLLRNSMIYFASVGGRQGQMVGATRKWETQNTSLNWRPRYQSNRIHACNLITVFLG